MAAVTLERLTKVYDRGSRAALDQLSLTVVDGEFLVLLGPSGCGKTTALRCIAGLEEPTAGTIRIGTRDVTQLAPGARDVAMVFQNYALYPHLTVTQNLSFALEMRRVPASEIARRVTDVAARLGLSELLARRPGALSGGQRQRVALGRALVRDPAVFLLDEPLSNLDAQLRGDLRAELLALHRSLGATMLYVTHDQVEAMTMGERIAVLHEGRLRQIGAPRDVYERPADTFVARFIGSPGMNVFEAPRAADGRGVLIGGSLAVETDLPVDGAFQVGVRPEHVVVRTRGRGGGQGEGHVRIVEPLGADTLVHVDVGTTRLIARVRGLKAPAVGDHVGVRIDAGDLHVFDSRGVRRA